MSLQTHRTSRTVLARVFLWLFHLLVNQLARKSLLSASFFVRNLGLKGFGLYKLFGFGSLHGFDHVGFLCKSCLMDEVLHFDHTYLLEDI